MGDANVHLKSRVGTRIQQLREAAGLTQQQLAAGCGIDPATLSKVETGKRNMTLESLQFVMAALGVAPRDFFAADEFASLLASTGGVAAPGESDALSLVQYGKDLHASFPCGVFEGSVRLPHMNRERVIEAILKLRAGLHQAELAQSSGEPAARTLMSKAIAESFLSLVRHSTKTNPSDVWRYLIYRAFLDPLNHPASSSGKNFDQSWKRTSGWALEQILAMNYGDFLKSRNILITSYTSNSDRVPILELMGLTGKVAPDKVDQFILVRRRDRVIPVGAIHLKSSLAERRTDDVPASRVIIDSGFVSLFVTMDVKDTPSRNPVNRGEYGTPGPGASEKRRDIEDRGSFSAVFSFNRNTVESPAHTRSGCRIMSVDFSDPDDKLTSFVCAAAKAALSRAKDRAANRRS